MLEFLRGSELNVTLESEDRAAKLPPMHRADEMAFEPALWVGGKVPAADRTGSVFWRKSHPSRVRAAPFCKHNAYARDARGPPSPAALHAAHVATCACSSGGAQPKCERAPIVA